jgi:hypothetical protein
MKSNRTSSPNHGPKRPNRGPERERIAIHVIHRMTTYQLQSRRLRFDEIVGMLGVERTELRRVLWALDRQGLIDAAQLSLTLSGFAMGHALEARDLPPLRRPLVDTAVVAA